MLGGADSSVGQSSTQGFWRAAGRERVSEEQETAERKCARWEQRSGERMEAWRVAGGLEAMTTPQHSG